MLGPWPSVCWRLGEGGVEEWSKGIRLGLGPCAVECVIVGMPAATDVCET